MRERKVKEVAGDEPQIRDKSHAELKASIPPEERRPGAYKMQLRPEEEEELALVYFPGMHHHFCKLVIAVEWVLIAGFILHAAVQHSPPIYTSQEKSTGMREDMGCMHHMSSALCVFNVTQVRQRL